MSLIELVVVGGMFLGLLVGAYTMLSNSTRYARETDANASAQQQAHLSMRMLVRELGNSVTRYDPSGGPWVRFLSAEPPDGVTGGVNFDGTTGKLIWRKFVCYWHDVPSQTLRRAEIPIPPPGAWDLTTEPAPAPLTPNAFQALAPSQQRIIARGVNQFDVTPASAESFNIVVSVQAIAAVATSGDVAKQHRVSVRTRVSVLNRWP